MKKLQKKIRPIDGTIEAFYCGCMCSGECVSCDCDWSLSNMGQNAFFQQNTNINKSYVYGTA